MEDFLKDEFDQFVKKLEKTEQFKSFVALDSRDLDALYTHGYICYENNKLNEAIDTFRYLVLQNALEGKYWFSLAASLQLKKNYFLSLRAWAMTSLLQPHTPFPHFHAAECYFSLNDPIEAMKALKAAERLLGEENSLKEKIDLLKTCWNKETSNV